ncbi:MAG: hypothetical protein KIT00_01690 [Rhodospirillales bacterium]|nr:hypothetical protein [Rhodospirillales bacterium]
MRAVALALVAGSVLIAAGGEVRAHGPGGCCGSPSVRPPSEAHPHPPPNIGPRPLPPKPPPGVQQRIQQIQTGQQPPAQNRQKALEKIRSTLDKVNRDTRWRDNVVNRVFIKGVKNLVNGTLAVESCVEAADDKADDSVQALQKLRDSGDLADLTITVGTRSGYRTGDASWHTYVVSEVRDSEGNLVDTIESDSYVLIADQDNKDDWVGPPAPIDWSDNFSKPKGTITPTSPASTGPSSPTTSTPGRVK